MPVADNNECTDDTNNCDANASYTNTDGSFMYTCNEGFEGSGDVCTNINECAPENTDKNNCGPDTDCEDTTPVIFAHAQTVLLVYQLTKKTDVKTLMNAARTVTITALIILVHTLVPVATVILVMVTLVLISTNVTWPYRMETENVVILTETSSQPNHIMPMVHSTMPVTTVTLEMASNVLISTNVSKVVITVMIMPLAPIPSVVGLVHVIPVTKVMVSVILILMNVSLAHVMATETVATMLDHTHALAMMDLMVTVRPVLISMNVFTLMLVTPMPPEETATVPTAAQVMMVTAMMV